MKQVRFDNYTCWDLQQQSSCHPNIKQLAQGTFSEAEKLYPSPVEVFQISLKLLSGFASFSTRFSSITISAC